MPRGLSLLFFLFTNLIFGSVQPLPALPAGTFINAVQVDSAGNIYLAGQRYANLPTPSTGHAFVGKLSPDGSKVIWWTTLAGSGTDAIQAMALGPDNSAYVTGTTQSPDFPTTNGSMQPTTGVFAQAFAAKLSPAGAVVYATYIGGSNQTSGKAIAVDSAGHAFITGSTGYDGLFPTTSGAITGATTPFNGVAFVMELNTSGSAALVALTGFGGSAIAVDPQGNIYAGGALFASVPTTRGALQRTTNGATCSSGGPGSIGPSLCLYQHVAKISPTGTELLFATYLNGSYGATPSAIAVDNAGNVIVAGGTNSPDYPTTPGAYQPEYFANPGLEQVGPFITVAPYSAGYVTKLNATGTDLLWSTLLGGSGPGDGIVAMTLDSSENILVSGHSASADFPGLWSTPVASRPPQSWEGFVARLSPDGTTLSPTQLVPGSVNITGLAVRSDGSVAVTGYNADNRTGVSPVLASVTIPAIGRVAAISDTADNAKLVSIAPGQLLTLYGTNLAAADTSVTFNGIPAPILYTSSTQINLQVPYEIAGMTEVTMQVSSTQESFTLAVVPRQPSIFLSPAAYTQPLFDQTVCNGQAVSGLQPLALNSDGTLNSCTNPAASGSTVTVFLNGLGLTAPAQTTGAISTTAVDLAPAGALPLPSAKVLSTTTVPGAIASLAQVRMQINSAAPYVNIPLQLLYPAEPPTLVRAPGILIWLK